MVSLRLPWSRGERFSTWSAGDPAFAAWLAGIEVGGTSEIVNARTVLGITAVARACSVISGTIAGLPLRTYERQGDERSRIDSVFDDPYPGIEGMTQFAWIETVLLHLLLWRDAYLWHEARDGQGFVTSYKPIDPSTITVKVENGKKRFHYTEDGEAKDVGTEMITHIPGPSLNGVDGFSILVTARNVFSGAISGDKSAALTLNRGIRLAGLIVPEEGEEVTPAEAEVILKDLRARVVGSENAGDLALINRRVKLQPWTPTNVESQFHETRQEVLGDVGRLFGVPPHLLNDTEKQTSWGTGVAEQNLGLARYTLMGWTSRIEQVLTRRLPKEQFTEFDYKGLLQGTPAQEVELLIEEVKAGLLDIDEARKVLNLSPRTAAQKAAARPAPMAPPRQLPIPAPKEATA